MRMNTQQSAFSHGVMHAWQAGTVSVPGLLLLHYRKLNLSELDVMIVIHIMYFNQQEHKEFPTWEELASRMSVPAAQVSSAIQRLVKEGILQIDEDVDPQTGVHFERYNLAPLAAKLAAAAETAQNVVPAAPEPSLIRPKRNASVSHIFSAFEQEFARPLSPMEYETIVSWLDVDRYPEELILMALKEAVFAGKVHLKYIDRILIEWSRNRIRTAEQAKEYAQRFRGSR